MQMGSTTRVRLASAVLLASASIGAYVAWLDPKSHALVDVFVMNFATRVVYDYAPGSVHPESSGTVTVEHRGSHPIP